jgi:quercetin dioxygenase-like cupin family protein
MTRSKPVNSKPPLRIKLTDAPQIVVQPPNNTPPFTAHIVHGQQASFMIGDRPPGYHTRPHTHDCEQWNYIVSGELWFFVEDHAYKCGPGDVLRVPKNRVHWVWNKSDERAVLIECHTPRITHEPHVNKFVSLLGEDEKMDGIPTVENIHVDYDKVKFDAKEAAAMKAEMAERGIGA